MRSTNLQKRLPARLRSLRSSGPSPTRRRRRQRNALAYSTTKPAHRQIAALGGLLTGACRTVARRHCACGRHSGCLSSPESGGVQQCGKVTFPAHPVCGSHVARAWWEAKGWSPRRLRARFHAPGRHPCGMRQQRLERERHRPRAAGNHRGGGLAHRRHGQQARQLGRAAAALAAPVRARQRPSAAPAALPAAIALQRRRGRHGAAHERRAQRPSPRARKEAQSTRRGAGESAGACRAAPRRAAAQFKAVRSPDAVRASG